MSKSTKMIEQPDHGVEHPFERDILPHDADSTAIGELEPFPDTLPEEEDAHGGEHLLDSLVGHKDLTLAILANNAAHIARGLED